MGISVEKNGFTTAGSLTLDIVQTMLANGFTLVYPVADKNTHEVDWPTGTAAEDTFYLLEAGPDVDPLNAAEVDPKQPWRVHFKVYDNATMGIVVGADSALPDDGSLPYGYEEKDATFYGVSSGYDYTPHIKTYFTSPYGVVGAPYTKQLGWVPVTYTGFAKYCQLWPEQILQTEIYTPVVYTSIPAQNKAYANAIAKGIYVSNFSVGGGYYVYKYGWAFDSNGALIIAGHGTSGRPWNTGMDRSVADAYGNAVSAATYVDWISAYQTNNNMGVCKSMSSFAWYASYTSTDDIYPNFTDETQGFVNRCHRMWEGIELPRTDWSQILNNPNELNATAQKPDYPGADNDVSAAHPMTYRMSITDRGLYLAVWEGDYTNSDAEFFSWMLVQRPVHHDTGATVTEGRAPVFCVNSVGNQIQRFVVREADVTQASPPLDATQNATDMKALINPNRQVGVTENNEFVVNYPSKITTTRFAYTYELDMIGYTSATVVGAGSDVPQTLYGETESRTYTGMMANMTNQNGMRILCLTAGGRL